MSIKDFVLGEPIKVNLPEHVKHAIEKQQLTSEKIISWVQLFIILIFSALYAVSPKAHLTAGQFAPVPWALSAYLLFSLIRLFFSYRAYLPSWFLFLSIIIDTTLLMTLIWSFHLQYQQPASFYLKAPTLLYIFIFIALRALRFDAIYILSAGLVAIIGWLVLLGYALLTAPADSVTRDYVQYMTSNHILIGGEIDKLISIFMVTLILAIAAARGKRLLEQAVFETTAAGELSKFFIPEVAANIIQADYRIKPGQGELHDVAILHCDIRGFTPQAELLPPNELIKMLIEYQGLVVNIIRKHHGSVDKFLGDGILCSFNAIKICQHYAVDAMQAAMEVVTAISHWSEQRQAAGQQPIKIGVTVTAGQAIVGVVGAENRLEYTIIGDPVNIAAKLDKQCKVENCQVLVTEYAFDLAVEQGYISNTVKKLPKRQVAGVNEPLDLVVLS